MTDVAISVDFFSEVGPDELKRRLVLRDLGSCAVGLLFSGDWPMENVFNINAIVRLISCMVYEAYTADFGTGPDRPTKQELFSTRTAADAALIGKLFGCQDTDIFTEANAHRAFLHIDEIWRQVNEPDSPFWSPFSGFVDAPSQPAWIIAHSLLLDALRDVCIAVLSLSTVAVNCYLVSPNLNTTHAPQNVDVGPQATENCEALLKTMHDRYNSIVQRAAKLTGVASRAPLKGLTSRVALGLLEIADWCFSNINKPRAVNSHTEPVVWGATMRCCGVVSYHCAKEVAKTDFRLTMYGPMVPEGLSEAFSNEVARQLYVWEYNRHFVELSRRYQLSFVGDVNKTTKKYRAIGDGLIRHQEGLEERPLTDNEIRLIYGLIQVRKNLYNDTLKASSPSQALFEASSVCPVLQACVTCGEMGDHANYVDIVIYSEYHVAYRGKCYIPHTWTDRQCQACAAFLLEHLPEAARKKLVVTDKTQSSTLGVSNSMVKLYLRGMSESPRVATAIQSWVSDVGLETNEFLDVALDLFDDVEDHLRSQDHPPFELCPTLFADVAELKATWRYIKSQYSDRIGQFVVMNKQGIMMFGTEKVPLSKAYSAECARLNIGGPFYLAQIGSEDENRNDFKQEEIRVLLGYALKRTPARREYRHRDSEVLVHNSAGI